MVDKLRDYFQFPPFSPAMRQVLAEGYPAGRLRADVVAGLVVAMVALPLAMALSVAVGLPPQHGLYTAIVAGVVTPLIGGSRYQVTGPTAAFVVILVPIVTEFGLRGLILTEIMAGLLLVFMALARMGRYVGFVPFPVTAGFTAGIAVVIGTLSLNDFLGLGLNLSQGEFVHKLALLAGGLKSARLNETMVGLVTLLTMIYSRRVLPRIPAPLTGVAAGVGFSLLMSALGGPEAGVATIGSRFQFSLPEGGAGHGVPPYPPTFHWFTTQAGALYAWPSWAELKSLFTPALVVSALAAIESLLSAAVADNMTGKKHEPNAELLACGAANVIGGFFACIPATGAIARTATNIHAGAVSPLAAVVHALALLAFMLAFAQGLAYVPMASLAALMLHVAWNMSHYKQCLRVFRIASKSDSMVLLTCFGLTVFIDMTAGVAGGLILSCILFVRRIATMTEADNLTGGATGGQQSSAGTLDRNDGLPPDLPTDLPPGVSLFRISGYLFFGSVEKALQVIQVVQGAMRAAIIDLTQVPFVDMSGVNALQEVIKDLVARGVDVHLVGRRRITRLVGAEMPVEIRRRVWTFRELQKSVDALNGRGGEGDGSGQDVE